MRAWLILPGHHRTRPRAGRPGQHEQAPDVYGKPLERELTQAGAADPELVDAARELMKLLDAVGSAAGKDSSGVQASDHNTQVNHFGTITFGRDMTINPRWHRRHGQLPASDRVTACAVPDARRE